ncbi:dynein regulatory complex protein 1-like [Pholidichthys leucotaenia]
MDLDPCFRLNSREMENDRHVKNLRMMSENDVIVRMAKLLRDLTTFVTNIQTAAEAKELQRRTELEETQRIRQEWLVNDAKPNEKQLEEISTGWSAVNQKPILLERKKFLDNQQQLCDAVVEQKKKLIKDLQQKGDDRYAKNLRMMSENIDQMIERMQDQIKILTKAYREELAQAQRLHEKEIEILLTEDKAELEQRMAKLLDNEMKRLVERRQKVEEYEEKIHNKMLECTTEISVKEIEYNEEFQVLEQEQQKVKGTKVLMRLKRIIQDEQSKQYKHALANIKTRIHSLQTEMKNLRRIYSTQEECHCLLNKHRRSIEQYENIQKQIKHFVVADARMFEEMWVTTEEEVKPLVEKVLIIDSLVYKQHLDLARQLPLATIKPQKQTASAQPSLKANSEVEEEKLSTEILRGIMELLCDEAGLLMECKLEKLLAPLEKSEQTAVKISWLLSTLDLEDEDLPKLHLSSEFPHVEESEVSATGSTTSELIHPNQVLNALKSFLEQRNREKSAHQHPGFCSLEGRDASEDEAYWKSVYNFISEDWIRLWDAAERTLQQYEVFLTEISEFVLEADYLRLQNTDLRVQLHQLLSSTGPFFYQLVHECLALLSREFERYILTNCEGVDL